MHHRRPEEEGRALPGSEDFHAETRSGFGKVQDHQEGVHQGAFALVRRVSCLVGVIGPPPPLQTPRPDWLSFPILRCCWLSVIDADVVW